MPNGTNPELSTNTINNALTAQVTLSVPRGTKPGKFGTAVVYSGDVYGNYWPLTVISK